MFKVFKYLFLASLYKKAKKSFIMLFVYIVALMITSFIFNDLINITDGGAVYMLILTKWIIVLSLWSMVGFSILKIFNVATNPFETTPKKVLEPDAKKDRVLNKNNLRTRSDFILQKYMKD